MNEDWVKGLERSSARAATTLPPAMVEETGWDILLALHSDRRCALNLQKLAALASVSEVVMGRWLGGLAERHLINGAKDSLTGEPHTVLTTVGRQLLDRYLAAAIDLRVGAHH